jgi:fructuronate reductase
MTRRIVHIGLGNFARAHLCDYTQDAGGWEITGVSLRSTTVRDGLAAQGYDYDLCIMGQAAKRITCVRDVLVAPENPKAVLRALAEADLISITVTEKGYHLDAAGALDLTDPLIGAEIAGGPPQTVIGFLAVGLARRARPVTVLCCDNRVENGSTLERAVHAFAETARVDIDWDAVTFPNAMVDRITPATTDDLRSASGDPMAVPTEPFREWVIEDRFLGDRPDWPDVQYVKDVRPHELRKLRMLNGAHSLMAYAGVLAGHTYVHEAIADAVLRARVLGFMNEAATTLPQDVQDLAPEYAKALIARFENPHLAHRLRQIAMDGSQKVPYRFAGTLRDLRSGGLPSDAVARGLCAWLEFCKAEVAAGRSLDDPKSAQIAKAVAQTNPDQALLQILGASDLLDSVRNSAPQGDHPVRPE